MALFDKVSGLAKSASDKTASMIETTTLNAKINMEEKNIAALTARLGEYYLAKYEAGALSAEGEAAEIYAEIAVCRENIAALQAEIDEAKAAKEVQQPAPDAAAGAKFCPNCGEALGSEARFCPSCGTKQG